MDKTVSQKKVDKTGSPYRIRLICELVGVFSTCLVPLNLQMTFLVIQSKAEKYFLYFKSIRVARSPIKVKFQATDSFGIATIDSAYLNL